MADIWFISDTHFFHRNILKFTDDDGQLIRPGFVDEHHMNEYIIERWNSLVKPQDHVWHLGDVALQVQSTPALAALLRRLNGHKRLVIGNHDNIKAVVETGCFEKIQLWRRWDDLGFTCSHIPLRLDSLRGGTVCVHGHIHQRMMKDKGYINVSVEVRDYTPVHIDQIIHEVKAIQD